MPTKIPLESLQNHARNYPNTIYDVKYHDKTTGLTTCKKLRHNAIMSSYELDDELYYIFEPVELRQPEDPYHYHYNGKDIEVFIL
jgi:hypothetical protein